MKTREIVCCFFLVCALGGCCGTNELKTEFSDSDLCFTAMPQSWDEGVPLGNGTVGLLVWNNGEKIRFSLDRTDLWDLRPTDSLSGDNFSFEWVKEHIRKKDYLPVQKKMDWPYDLNAAPTKIPGAALEFPAIDSVLMARLYIKDAVCKAQWVNGVSLSTFVQASRPIGWFVFDGVDERFGPVIVPPCYSKGGNEQSDPVTGQDLRRLGYEQGIVSEDEGRCVYHQQGWGDFSYDVAVRWHNDKNGSCIGVWSVTSSLSGERAETLVDEAWERGIGEDYLNHKEYWNGFWKQSSVQIPDSLLQKQYDSEMYKLASSARENSYPISLQAVWTADNGKLPPWKGDYHHDLNTQLSYWPVYTGNHLSEGLGYLNTLWNQREVYKMFTKDYFGCDGLNVPGVCTLTGEAMGGWIQYSMSQTTACWLSQHFYLHWKYSGDTIFLKQRAYPFVCDAARFIEHQLKEDGKGKLGLEFSSSPEIFDNSLQAWFTNMTNYDLSLIRFLLKAATDMAYDLSLTDEAQHWLSLYDKLPDFDLDEDGALTFAKGVPYNMSHRHFSHAMAIHPLGLIDVEDGDSARRIIDATLKKMEKIGPDWWTGYSYAWYGTMWARARNGEAAADALRTFATCFCLPNTFHVNGDQSGTHKSNFTYRPFTLEGNFAFASGIQEMLLQSHRGVIRVFPAIPESWKDVSFENLRAMGAFLVSAVQKEGVLTKLRVFSVNGGELKIISPIDGTLLRFNTQAGEWIDVV